MQVNYELTQKDFYESLLAHRKLKPISPWFVRIVVVLACILVGAATFVHREMPTSPMLLLSLILIPLSLFLTWGVPWLSARTQFGKQPAAQGPHTMLLDSSGVHEKGSGVTSDIEWRNLIRWTESKNQFLLYTSPASFNCVPKRVMTPAEVNEFRAMLVENIKKK
jgi:hypothetical protein